MKWVEYYSIVSFAGGLVLIVLWFAKCITLVEMALFWIFFELIYMRALIEHGGRKP